MKKNFEANHFTKKMKYPFSDLDDTALGHYFTQLPFYGKLFLDMLKGSKYENLKLFGCDSPGSDIGNNIYSMDIAYPLLYTSNTIENYIKRISQSHIPLFCKTLKLIGESVSFFLFRDYFVRLF